MTFLNNFTLLDSGQEHEILAEGDIRRIYNTVYPLHLFDEKGFSHIDFDNITIFYGGNGSGKTTLLNIIADKLQAIRKSTLNKGNLFKLYVDNCTYEMNPIEPLEIKIISSDDIFDYLLDIRSINANIHRRKEQLSQEYSNIKFNNPHISIDNYEEIKNSYDAKHESVSRYVRKRLGNNTMIEQSNGESALMFWEQEIKENSIYILDEPENSLSAENQLKLKQFIEESVRFYNCQFIISTHSPFLLNLTEAKIYDLDEVPVIQKKWTELQNVQLYYQFFKEREHEF